MVDLTQIYSHPNKQLTEHTDNVVEKVKSLTNLKIAEIAAIFHDAGKLNPNFQLKLKQNFNEKTKIGYSNHAYLSALSFICYCKKNQDRFLSNSTNKIDLNKIASILTIIAHHHGDLPDFPNILNEDEYSDLLSFLDKNPDLPISEFIGHYMKHNYFSVTNLKSEELEHYSRDFLLRITDSKYIKNPLDFFIETQFAFASVIVADKSDASDYETKEYITEFCNKYNSNLEAYTKQFEINSKINKIRNEMRKEANEKINEELNKNSQRIFSLTAPTGSGKTMMLLSLAGKILNLQKNLRIIYALPFLSITEQVEEICSQVFEEQKDYIKRIDSKSENKYFEKLQSELDNNPKAIRQIIDMQFAEDTFDYPFIITTFVRLFETLVSNRNSTLLKLPNFANTIFLIDEIQSLPPRLYGFFVALLDSFCKKFNSYAIISTATMPEFELPEKNDYNLHEFFANYTKPTELLSLKYFKEDVFNRYTIESLPNPVTICDIVDMLKKERSSILIILNTIDDTKNLFDKLKREGLGAEIILLNTHFTIKDRKTKIKRSKELLNEGKRVIIISTQLIEAGVDIDFPIVYRDLCPIPNIVQSAGRCNRNNQKNNGKMIVFDLQKDNKSRSSLIYKGKDARFLNFAREKIKNCKLHECELIDLQKSFFKDIQENTLFGTHSINESKNEEINFIQAVKELAFEKIGKFRLIDEQKFGEEYRYYVCKTKEDELKFKKLKILDSKLRQIDFKDFQNRKIKNIEIKNQLKNMADNIIQIRLKQSDSPPVREEECFGLSKLSFKDYNEDTGICLTAENQIL
jgi:CRISPR-associated helicase Cas3/CRISPR-associated endonuclease Cas3-HD